MFLSSCKVSKWPWERRPCIRRWALQRSLKPGYVMIARLYLPNSPPYKKCRWFIVIKKIGNNCAVFEKGPECVNMQWSRRFKCYKQICCQLIVSLDVQVRIRQQHATKEREAGVWLCQSMSVECGMTPHLTFQKSDNIAQHHLRAMPLSSLKSFCLTQGPREA